MKYRKVSISELLNDENLNMSAQYWINKSDMSCPYCYSYNINTDKNYCRDCNSYFNIDV